MRVAYTLLLIFFFLVHFSHVSVYELSAVQLPYYFGDRHNTISGADSERGAAEGINHFTNFKQRTENDFADRSFCRHRLVKIPGTSRIRLMSTNLVTSPKTNHNSDPPPPHKPSYTQPISSTPPPHPQPTNTHWHSV